MKFSNNFQFLSNKKKIQTRKDRIVLFEYEYIMYDLSIYHFLLNQLKQLPDIFYTKKGIRIRIRTVIKKTSFLKFNEISNYNQEQR